MSRAGPSATSDSVSSLSLLKTSGLVETIPKGDTDLENIVDTHLTGLNFHALEFLSIQQEMLIASKQAERSDTTPDKEEWNKGKFGGRSFEGLALHRAPIVDDSGIRMDCYDSDTQKISLCPIDAENPIPSTLAHEMTHAIDDVYDDRRSGVRVLETLQASDLDHLSQISCIENVKNLLPIGIRGVFNKLYVEPTKKGELSFVDACVSAEAKEKSKVVKTPQEHAAARLLTEFASFSYETIFAEIASNPDKPSKFLQDFKLYNPKESSRPSRAVAVDAAAVADGSKIIAQEIVAVSMYHINEEMIAHLEAKKDIAASTSVSVTAPPELLLGRLYEIRGTLQPAYDRVISKVPGLVSVRRGASSLAKRMSDGISNSNDDLVHIDEASRMRASLTRAEAESGGKAQYGDLKRTMSPIRRRAATVLGGRM